MGIVQTAEQTIANGLFRQQDLQNTRTRLRTLLCIEGNGGGHRGSILVMAYQWG